MDYYAFNYYRTQIADMPYCIISAVLYLLQGTHTLLILQKDLTGVYDSQVIQGQNLSAVTPLMTTGHCGPKQQCHANH